MNSGKSKPCIKEALRTLLRASEVQQWKNLPSRQEDPGSERTSGAGHGNLLAILSENPMDRGALKLIVLGCKESQI